MDKRDTIVSAACAMLGSVGVGRLTVALVAREATVSTALVHYHFATKKRNVLGPIVGLSRIYVVRHEIPSRHRGGANHRSPRENWVHFSGVR